MKTSVEIRQIAANELKHPDTICDIKDENFERPRLWKSAFALGYEMGQAGVEKYDEIP